MEDLSARFQAICLKLWGDKEGEEIYKWIVDTRPPYFHGMVMQVMVPMWEMNKVDMKTKILAMCACFTARHMQEVEFMFKAAAHHGIPQEQVEEIVLMAGLEGGFPSAEMAVHLLMKVYQEHAEKHG